MFDSPALPRDIVSSPFLRWVGGKARLLPTLRAALPRGRRLIEPFTGSAAVFLGTRYDRYLLNDANPDLIHLYQWLQKDVARFLRFARPLFLGRHPDEATYERTRDAFNRAERGSLERAVLFLWLNHSCFNGVCRYNRKGEFNVPRGDDKGDLLLPERELLAFHAKAQAADIRLGDFRDVLAEAGEGDVVYCDPPYVPRSATASFTKYTEGDFGREDQEALAEACRAAAARGAAVVVSNSDTPETRAIYHDALMVSARLSHIVGSRGDARVTVGEALLLYGEPGDCDFWSMGRRGGAAALAGAAPRGEPDPPAPTLFDDAPDDTTNEKCAILTM